MARDCLSRLARRRAMYTGEAHSQARRCLEASGPGGRIIPDAGREQALLERDVFDQLDWPHHFTLYPFGFKCVSPRPDSITIKVESEDAARETVDSLLPAAQDCGEVGGVLGLRVDAIGNRTLHLRRVGTRARVQLTGCPARVWKEAITDVQERCRQVGLAQCWATTSDTMSTVESDFAATYPELFQDEAESAWLGSGLLRRIGILQMAGMHIRTTAWTNSIRGGLQWCVEMVYGPDLPMDHDLAIELLLDADCGLPLQESHRWCSHSSNSVWEAACVIDLSGRAGFSGELNLRFCHRSEERMEYLEKHFPGQLASVRRRYAQLRRGPSRAAAAGGDEFPRISDPIPTEAVVADEPWTDRS